MSEITVVGLGAMGSALAGALLKAGRKVTVWNRSSEKMDALIDQGAIGAASLGDAVRASTRIIICIDNYDLTAELFEPPEVSAHLDGRTVIQMSTGTPKDAESGETLFHRYGAGYLDCAIMVNPVLVGTNEGQILIAGPEHVYQDCLSYFQNLGGKLHYLGANARSSAALDMAILSRFTCAIIGSLHGAQICEAEGVSLDQFADALPVGDRSRALMQAVQNDFDVSGGGATVNVYEGCVGAIAEHAHDAGINSEIPDLLLSLAKRAKNAGYGSQETAAVLKVLRGSNET